MRSLRVTMSIGVCLVAVSCSSSPLPLPEWESGWRDVVDTVESTRATEVTDQGCQQTLGYLREVRPELTPPPIEDLEVPVDEWFDEAEDVFFECEPSNSATRSRALQRMSTLEAEVETVLSLEG